MISAQLRRTVRTLYAFACGYCGVSETEVGAYLTVDHFMPQEAGGSDDIENLVYACHACNLHKSTAWSATAPPVLHPLRTEMTLHFRLISDGSLQSLSPEGAQHIETLHLNRPPLVEHRKNKALLQALLASEIERQEREKRIDEELNRRKAKIRRKRTK